MGCGAQEETTEVQSVTAAKRTLGWGESGAAEIQEGTLAGLYWGTGRGRLGFQKF